MRSKIIDIIEFSLYLVFGIFGLYSALSGETINYALAVIDIYLIYRGLELTFIMKTGHPSFLSRNGKIELKDGWVDATTNILLKSVTMYSHSVTKTQFKRNT